MIVFVIILYKFISYNLTINPFIWTNKALIVRDIDLIMRKLFNGYYYDNSVSIECTSLFMKIFFVNMHSS